MRITLVYDIPEGEFAEKRSLDVIKEVYDYANRGLVTVIVDLEKEGE
jgi:hypothetical protein